MNLINDDVWFLGHEIDDFAKFYYPPAFRKVLAEYVARIEKIFESEREEKHFYLHV